MVPTWKNTFNSDHKAWASIQKALSTAVLSGYPFFSHHGRIYEIIVGRNGEYDQLKDTLVHPESLDRTCVKTVTKQEDEERVNPGAQSP